MLFTKKSIIGIRSETFQGVPVPLVSTDFFLAEISFVNPIFSTLENNRVRVYNDTLDNVSHTKYSDIKIRVELKSLDTIYTLFKTFSLQEIFVPPDITRFSLQSSVPSGMLSPSTSVTVEWYMDGFKHRIYGAIATSARFSFAVSEISYVDVTLKGKYETPSSSSLPIINIDTTYLPPIFENNSVLLNSIPCNFINRIEVDFGIETFMYPDLSDSSGYGNCVLLYTKINGSIDPEMERTDVINYFTYIETLPSNTLSWTVGDISENYFSFYLNKIQIQRLKHNNRKGIFKSIFSFICNRPDENTSSFIMDIQNI